MPCLIRDRISYDPPLGAAAAALAGSTLEGEMKRLFRFRNQRLAQDLARHGAYGGPSLKVAMTGAGGFIGSALRHFLATGGHEVVPIVRRRPDRDLGEVYWDPMERKIEGQRLEGVDALVHLAGESLSRGRWTPAKKKAIWKSRVVGTRVLADTLNRLRDPPRVFVSSSAVGYYGNRGPERLSERSRPGSGFLPDLCREWENEALKAARSGVRVVLLRTGLALSPAGGALGTMLLPFKLGIGGRLGSGRQYVSWIDHDDLVALIFHALVTPGLRGPVNATAPHPVTNATFTTKLGHALRRPTLLPVPSLAVRGILGEMGEGSPARRRPRVPRGGHPERVPLRLPRHRRIAGLPARAGRAGPEVKARAAMAHTAGPLRCGDLSPDPVEQFARWFAEAEADPRIVFAEAVCLSTLGPGGTPEGRMVLLKHFDARGFVF